MVVKGVGEQSCNFICLNEFAHGTILALNPLGFTVINLDGHEAITNNKLIEMLELRIGKRARFTNWTLIKRTCIPTRSM